MTVSKLHHFNPQFVLRCFADENGRITTIRQPERRSRTSRVRETGAENHLYSMPGHPHGSDVFEKALGAGIETETALLFERVVKGEWPLPQLDRNTLAEFIALQIIRGPEQRRLMESTASRLVKSAVAHLGMDGMTRWASDTAGQPITDEEAEELLKLVTEDDGVVIPYTARDRIEHESLDASDSCARVSGYAWSNPEQSFDSWCDQERGFPVCVYFGTQFAKQSD